MLAVNALLLLPRRIVRWTPRRKYELLVEYENLADLPAKNKLLYDNEVTFEEFAFWQRKYYTHGVKGLRVTKRDQSKAAQRAAFEKRVWEKADTSL